MRYGGRRSNKFIRYTMFYGEIPAGEMAFITMGTRTQRMVSEREAQDMSHHRRTLSRTKKCHFPEILHRMCQKGKEKVWYGSRQRSVLSRQDDSQKASQIPTGFPRITMRTSFFPQIIHTATNARAFTTQQNPPIETVRRDEEVNDKVNNSKMTHNQDKTKHDP